MKKKITKAKSQKKPVAKYETKTISLAAKKNVQKTVSEKRQPLHESGRMTKNGTGIFPLGSRVLIRPFTKAEVESAAGTKNTFGFILPDADTKQKSEQGVVLAVGPGEFRDGVIVAPQVKMGDKICFSKYGYDDISVGGEELYLIKEENILAILN